MMVFGPVPTKNVVGAHSKLAGLLDRWVDREFLLERDDELTEHTHRGRLADGAPPTVAGAWTFEERLQKGSLRSAAFVMVVQTTEVRDRHDAAVD